MRTFPEAQDENLEWELDLEGIDDSELDEVSMEILCLVL